MKNNESVQLNDKTLKITYESYEFNIAWSTAFFNAIHNKNGSIKANFNSKIFRKLDAKVKIFQNLNINVI